MENPMFRPAMIMTTLVASLACGGGGSGVDESKALSDLSDDEKASLCEDRASDFEASTKLTCYATAIGTATCEADAQACIDESANDDPCADVATDEFPACASEVTVGEFGDCYDAQVVRVKDVAADINCDSDLEAIFTMLSELPAECDQVEMDCPDLLGG